jgi:hypothetical protein
MSLSFPWLFFFLVLVPRRVYSLFELVAYSRVQQCGPFNVSFSGGQLPAALPLTLTVVPFDSVPLTFTIPELAWDNSTNSGSYVTYLPLSAGVSFLASLDDAAGNSAALMSDITQVMPDTNTSCIAANQTISSPFQIVDDAVSQCTPFNISQNTSDSSLNHTLSVRVYIPMSLSFILGWTDFHQDQDIDTFTCIMNVAAGIRVAMLFDDEQGNRQVSDLLLVGGGASSPSGCLLASSVASTAAAQVAVKGISKSAISPIPRFS